MTTKEVRPAEPTTGAKLTAEAVGTFLLVFSIMGIGVFGSYLLMPDMAPVSGIVAMAVAAGIGLSVTVGAYAFGPISGGHFNPAVTLGLAAAGRFPWSQTVGYIVAQVVGGALATTAALAIGTFGPKGWVEAAMDSGLASNGWGELSPGGFGMVAAIIIEVIVTAIFLLVILGVTHPERSTPFAGLAIGVSLAILLLIAIPVDYGSMNPARSLATAIYGGGTALGQVWVFIVFPIVGALIAGFSYRLLFDARKRS